MTMSEDSVEDSLGDSVQDSIPRPPRMQARPARGNEWETLRELILGQEQVRLQELEQRPQELHGEDVSEVLPEAVARAVSQGPALAGALESTIESGLETSARKNPKVLAEAIYPVLGPAIRRMIQALLTDSLQGFNSAMENTFSPAGVRWRLESWRTGRPFAEVVMLHNLEWRVEQVFLIHKETGLLIQEASARGSQGQDPDLVSSMLTAIQDFVRDSFAEGDDGELEQVELSGYRILIAQGPQAVLAAVVSGVPPAELHVELEETLLEQHVEHARALAEFDGDTLPFVSVRPVLESCLREQAKVRQKSSLGPLILAGLATLVVALLAWSWWVDEQRDQAFNQLVASVENEPGLQLLEASRDGREVILRGSADPLALRPGQIAGARDLLNDLDLEERWAPVQSMDETMVLRRASKLLEPPKGLKFKLREGQLAVTGKASAAWIARAERLAPQITGEPLDGTGLVNTDQASVDRLLAALDGQLLPFGVRANQMDRSDPVVAGRLAQLAELDRAALAVGRALRLDLLGVVSEEEQSSPGLAERRAAAAWEAIHQLDPAALVPVAAPESPSGPRRSPSPGVRLSLRLLPSLQAPR